MQILYLLLLFPFLLLLLLTPSVSSLVLLDPNTGRAVSQHPQPRQTQRQFWMWRHTGNGIEHKPQTVLAQAKAPVQQRSDYISESGTPLYKLRQRNPYGG